MKRQLVAILGALVLTPAVGIGTATAAQSNPVKIMPLGDSITDGFVVPGGYRTLLWENLQGDNINFVGSVHDGPAALGDKDHEGHVGWCLAGTYCGKKGKPLTSIIDSRLATYKPDIILLHGGTNDLNDGYTGAQTAAHLDTLIGKIFTDEPHVTLIVAAIIPAGFGKTKEQNWKAYEAAIPNVINKYRTLGDNIEEVDMSSLLVPNTADYYQSSPTSGHDSLHPSQQGYNKMANAWYPAVTSAYQKIGDVPSPPPPAGTNYFANCDPSVETSSCWTGVYSSSSKVTVVSTDAKDGTHSVRYTSTTAGAAGLNAKPAPVTDTIPGTAFTAGVWVHASQPGITVTLGLREKRPDRTGAGYSLTSWKATDTGWHYLTAVYTAKEAGNSLTYSVYSPSLAGGWVDSDLFTLTS